MCSTRCSFHCIIFFGKRFLFTKYSIPKLNYRTAPWLCRNILSFREIETPHYTMWRNLLNRSSCLWLRRTLMMVYDTWCLQETSGGRSWESRRERLQFHVLNKECGRQDNDDCKQQRHDYPIHVSCLEKFKRYGNVSLAWSVDWDVHPERSSSGALTLSETHAGFECHFQGDSKDYHDEECKNCRPGSCPQNSWQLVRVRPAWGRRHAWKIIFYVVWWCRSPIQRWQTPHHLFSKVEYLTGTSIDSPKSGRLRLWTEHISFG